MLRPFILFFFFGSIFLFMKNSNGSHQILKRPNNGDKPAHGGRDGVLMHRVRIVVFFLSSRSMNRMEENDVCKLENKI